MIEVFFCLLLYVGGSKLDKYKNKIIHVYAYEYRAPVCFDLASVIPMFAFQMQVSTNIIVQLLSYSHSQSFSRDKID